MKQREGEFQGPGSQSLEKSWRLRRADRQRAICTGKLTPHALSFLRQQGPRI